MGALIDAAVEAREGARFEASAPAVRPAGRRSERVARRNVTFSPRHGTRVLVAAR